MDTRAGPITYHAKALGQRLGLSNLFVSFNGFWPEKGAFSEACSFKEYEAYPTLQRMRERKQGVLQISSAGNTARAFAIASSKTGAKVVLAVPKSGLDRVWTLNPSHENILLFAIDGDYYDAITFGRSLVDRYEDLLPEGGARNVARRDGMGLTMLDATHTIGQLPDYYFQGVGSGTGGIAAYEMALKLVGDGRYGETVPRFFLSQNYPFIPMVNAWNDGRREIIGDIDMPDAKKAIQEIYAPLLSNRQPPFGITGGVFDVLQKSDGTMLSATNEEAMAAFELFKEVENIDIDPSAAVALASLVNITKNDDFNSSSIILLNISGGGYEKIQEENEIHHVKPNQTVSQDDFSYISDEVDRIIQDFLAIP